MAAAGCLAAGLHFTAEVRLGNDRTMLATTALAGRALLAALSALVARHSEPFGMIGIAMACVATSGFWLALGRHRFAGPVILTVGREHGIHIGDPLAVLPVIAGGWFVVRAFRLWGSRRPLESMADRPSRKG